jgi:hypothetical protein
MMPSADAANFALPVSGVLRKVQAIMLGRFAASLITAPGIDKRQWITKMNHDYNFTVTFAIPDSVNEEALETQLFEAGCDDAIVGLGQKGRLALNFNREAKSAEAAILSALRDVKSAVPEARLVESGPDLVGISDMAMLLAFSRQNMRKLIQTNLASFPLPVHEGASAIWHFTDVLAWFSTMKKRDIEPELMDVARVSMNVNLARETKRVDYQLQSQLIDIAQAQTVAE